MLGDILPALKLARLKMQLDKKAVKAYLFTKGGFIYLFIFEKRRQIGNKVDLGGLHNPYDGCWLTRQEFGEIYRKV